MQEAEIGDDLKFVLRVAEALQVLVAELLASADSALVVECLSLVTGIGYEGASESAIAAKYGQTRAAVSKRCIELASRLGVKNLRAMRHEQVREICRKNATSVDKKRGRTSDLRGAKRDTINLQARRMRVIFEKLLSCGWVDDASPSEMLLMRRALKPVFSIADDLERRVRYSGVEAIILELANDHAEHLPPQGISLHPPPRSRASRVLSCKNVQIIFPT